MGEIAGDVFGYLKFVHVSVYVYMCRHVYVHE